MILAITIAATLQGVTRNPGEFSIQLPAGPVARAHAAVTEDTAPAALDWGGLSGTDLWSFWAEHLESEAGNGAPDPAHRAALALVAKLQGRDADAWNHYAACIGDASFSAALLPVLFPGVPFGSDAPVAMLGGRPRALPAGVTLEPALPPTGAELPGLSVTMKLEGLEIGGASLGLEIDLSGDGIQVDVFHRGGEPVQFFLRLPEPREFEIRVAYLDWFRLDDARLPISVTISAEEPERTLFGRFLGRRSPWPGTLPQLIPAVLERHGMRIEVEEPISLEALSGIGGAMTRVLGVPCELVSIGPGSDPGPFRGLRVSFRRGEPFARKLGAVISLTERFALPRP